MKDYKSSKKIESQSFDKRLNQRLTSTMIPTSLDITHASDAESRMARFVHDTFCVLSWSKSKEHALIFNLRTFVALRLVKFALSRVTHKPHSKNDNSWRKTNWLNATKKATTNLRWCPKNGRWYTERRKRTRDRLVRQRNKWPLCGSDARQTVTLHLIGLIRQCPWKCVLKHRTARSKWQCEAVN